MGGGGGLIAASIDFPEINRQDRYWLGAVSDYYPFSEGKADSSRVQRELLNPHYSRSLVFDEFNSTNDKGLLEYDFYLRMQEPAETVFNRNVELFSYESDYFFSFRAMQTLSPDLGLYVLVMNGSSEFDHCLKSSMLYFVNSNERFEFPNPFAEQVTTYSNVENGTGVLAGFNQLLLPLHQNHCK